MPPFVPRKRVSSEDPPPPKRQAQSTAPPKRDLSDSSSDTSLSDVPEEINNTESVTPQVSSNRVSDDGESDEDDEDSEDEINWEDAVDVNPPSAILPSLARPEGGDLELILDQEEIHTSDLLDGKKGPSKIERHIRVQTHRMHVQCLLFHNALRNAWTCDAKIKEILLEKLPESIKKEVKKWKIASGLELPEKKPEPLKSKKKGKQARKKQDWSEDSERLEPGQSDMSAGDPIISLVKVLVAYWRKQFRITAPGLRKNGYRQGVSLKELLDDFHKENDPERHGERIANIEEFRAVAASMQGSRDVGAQLFTALVRALGIEARLVGSL